MPQYLDFEVFELPDMKPPTVVQVELDLSTGVLKITFSETILVTPYKGGSPAENVNMSSLILSNVTSNTTGFTAYPPSPLPIKSHPTPSGRPLDRGR